MPEISVFEKLLASKAIIADFIQNLVAIYEHDKTEIIEFLSAEPRACLVDLRNALLEECCILLPEYNNKYLFARRKSHTLAEDIYILGYSVVSKLQHKDLYRIFKDANPDENSINEVGCKSEEFSEILDVVAALKEQVNQLTQTVTNLRKRMETVEGVLTEKQLLELDAANSLKSYKDNMTGSEEVDTDEVSATMNGNQSNDEQAIIENNVASAAKKPNETFVQVIQTDPKPVEDDFRHSRGQRKDIRRGKHKVKSSQRPSIIGRSEERHQVKAASKHPVTSKEHSLVYIGKLSHDTDEQAVRNQLVDCGITQVADVIKLNCRKPDEASFCVSLYGSEAENAVYSPDNWPAGIIVRPYSQRSFSRSRPNQKGRYKPRQWQHGYQHRQRSEDAIRKSSWKPRVTPLWRDRDWSDHDSFPDYYRSDFTNEYDYRYNHSEMW